MQIMPVYQEPGATEERLRLDNIRGFFLRQERSVTQESTCEIVSTSHPIWVCLRMMLQLRNEGFMLWSMHTSFTMESIFGSIVDPLEEELRYPEF